MDPRFAQTVFIVEADSFAINELWLKYSKQGAACMDSLGGKSFMPMDKQVNWVQDHSGITMQVGSLDGRPVVMTCFWNFLDNLRVLFCSASSQVVDHAMIEGWLDENCNPKWDKGARQARCDAPNFHLCHEYVLHPDRR